MQFKFQRLQCDSRRPSRPCLGALIVVLSALSGCATVNSESTVAGTTTAYVREGNDGLLAAFAPVFVIEHDEKPYNKIGTPSARYNDSGHEEIYVDPSKPTIYEQIRTFETEESQYTNLIYRVHFEKSPFTWIPFNASAGHNVGAIAVVTLDEDENPVFLTTVQSCGCYHAITPTNRLDPDAYPADWTGEPVIVYGEHLPARVKFPDPLTPETRIVITIRDGTHRTKDISVARLDELANSYHIVEAAHAPMESLKELPLDDGSTSFYHTKGRKRGLVKGAYKPWETLLFGLWAWDSHVGQDREYASKADSGRRFYTTLSAWKKEDSDMWDYAGYLRHNGWKP